MLFLKPLCVPVLVFLMGNKFLLVFIKIFACIQDFYPSPLLLICGFLSYWCMAESKGNVCQGTTNGFFPPHESKQFSFSELNISFSSSDDFLKESSFSV